MKEPDPRNADILVHVGGRIVPRDQAKVSVFDSVVQGGDAGFDMIVLSGGNYDNITYTATGPNSGSIARDQLPAVASIALQSST